MFERPDLMSAFAVVFISLLIFQVLKWMKFYIDFRQKMKHIRKLPGHDLHPILGHLKDVRYTVLHLFVLLYCF